MSTSNLGTIRVLVGPPTFKTEQLALEVGEWIKLKNRNKYDIIFFHKQQSNVKRLNVKNEVSFSIKKSGKDGLVKASNSKMDYNVEARYYSNPTKILSYVQRNSNQNIPFVIAIDDCQFEQEYRTFGKILEELVNEGHYIIAAGTDQNSEGKPFPATSHLLAIADEVYKVPGRCGVCGAKAFKSEYIGDEPRTQKTLIPQDDNMKDLFADEDISERKKFEPRCNYHWSGNKVGNPNQERGHLTVFAGPMFSDKTTRLVLTANKFDKQEKINYAIYYPSPDDRSRKNTIQTHKINEKPLDKSARQVDKSDKIFQEVLKHKYDKILIDELHFFDEESIVDTVDKILKQGVDVYAAGLDLDFRGEPFMSVASLMAMSDTLHKLTTICQVEGCDNPGTRTQRKIDKKKTVNGLSRKKVGGRETYKVLCRFHHEKYIAKKFSSHSKAPQLLQS